MYTILMVEFPDGKRRYIPQLKSMPLTLPDCYRKSESEKEVLPWIRSEVEHALQYKFGRNTRLILTPNYPGDVLEWRLAMLKSYQGKLSIYPDKVSSDISRDSFIDQCVLFSRELQDNLQDNGVTVIAAKRTTSHISPHTFLMLPGEQNIIIDPTVGQFLEGHNHTFVGTEKQLYDTVAQYVREGRYWDFGGLEPYPSNTEAFIAYDNYWALPVIDPLANDVIKSKPRE